MFNQEPEFDHRDADLSGGEWITHTPSVEQLADGGSIHQLGWLAFSGNPEPCLDKLLLVALHTERLIETLHLLLVRSVKPVAETRLELMYQLGIELLVVNLPCARIIDVTYLEAEPATVARVVGQEMLLVTCGTE